jgi:hypothetical protein
LKNDILISAINFKHCGIFSDASSRTNNNYSSVGSLGSFAGNNKLFSTIEIPSSGHILFAPHKAPGLKENVT